MQNQYPAIISDMDGVIYRSKKAIDGAPEFINMLLEKKVRFCFLTNNSEQSPRDLIKKLETMGLKGLDDDHFITASMATADFLSRQRPQGSAYVIGGGGLVSELYKVGYSITESNPDYVVVGKTTSYNYEMIKKAVNLINRGAKFIATNPDVVDPTENGIEPACGSLIAPIELSTGKKPYIVGKPNPLMMAMALKKLNVHPWESVMIGDRMDTDILSGMEAGLKSCLVLSGVSTKEVITQFPYRPDFVVDSIAHIDLIEWGRRVYGNKSS